MSIQDARQALAGLMVARLGSNALPPPQGGAPVGPRPISRARILEELGTHLNNLWNLSNPHQVNDPVGVRRGPTATGVTRTTKQEQGCWVIYDVATGALRADDFAPGLRDGAFPHIPTMGNNEVAVTFFHTHPNTGDEGYDSGPSGADMNFANSVAQMPGLVRTQINGYTWFGPATYQTAGGAVILN